MGIVSGGPISGNTSAQVALSGKVLPVADATGVTVDTTTYSDPLVGGGAKLATLVFPVDAGLLALAQAGDTWPRLIISSDPINGGWFFGDGTIDPYNFGLTLGFTTSAFNVGGPVAVQAAVLRGQAPRMDQVSPKFAITSGALSTVQLVSGTGTQISTTRDVETITPCTFNPGAATTATVTVTLSPDNVTYSTLAVVTEPAGTAFDGTILPIKVRVPAGWYLKLTANAQAVLGLTTYY